MNITFEYGGKNYEVGIEAYTFDKILLPDKTLLEVAGQGWSESSPPKPLEMRVIPHTLGHLSLDDIAARKKAAVAWEAA